MLTFLSVYSSGIVFFTFFFGVINGYQEEEEFEDIHFLLILIWPATILIFVLIVFFSIIAKVGLWFGILVKKFIHGLQLKNRDT